jgi:ribitol-5-phosphate 2-dehydrogenase (NADP+)
MFVRSFKIVAPKRFDIYIEDLDPKDNEAIIKIEKALICKADMRYYLGNRDERTLGLKYPMNLLHEAIGTILNDSTGTFKPGDRVALVPNLTLNCDKSSCRHKVCKSARLGENYCPEAYFASSNYNGFSREFVNYPVSNLVPVAPEIDVQTAAFSELISIAYSMIRRVPLDENETIAVWGDGLLGYILSATLKTFHKGSIICIGKNPDKLSLFPVSSCYLTDSKDLEDLKIDTAFECVGGTGVEAALNQIIDRILPGGRIVLAGVPENNIQVNTRRILEKGLAIYGVTRSNVEDFRSAVAALSHPAFNSAISKLVLEEHEIKNITDFYKVFELEASNRNLGKHMLHFSL